MQNIMVKSLFCISVSIALAGMAFGIFMGIRQDFMLAPAHAHLNLLGFVTMFLSALYYRVFPVAAAIRRSSVSSVRSCFQLVSPVCCLAGTTVSNRL